MFFLDFWRNRLSYSDSNRLVSFLHHFRRKQERLQICMNLGNAIKLARILGMKIHRNHWNLCFFYQFKRGNFPFFIQNLIKNIVTIRHFSRRKNTDTAAFLKVFQSLTHSRNTAVCFFSGFKRIHRNHIIFHRLYFLQKKIAHDFKIRSNFCKDFTHQNSINRS